MDVSSTTPSAKRARAKPHTPSPAAAKPARKTLRASTKKRDAATTSAANESSFMDRHAAIQREAFYLAAARGFVPGHELDDWLEAERRLQSES